jgi:hypothetical protein
MRTVSGVTIGWKDLEGVLNRLVSAINRRTIETGYGLTKEEGENGVIIALESGKGGTGGDSLPSDNPTPWKYTPDGEQAHWQKVVVLDANCNPLEQYLWGGSPGGNPAIHGTHLTQSAQVPKSGQVGGPQGP